MKRLMSTLLALGSLVACQENIGTTGLNQLNNFRTTLSEKLFTNFKNTNLLMQLLNPVTGLFEVVDDPLYGRLVAWAILSGRVSSDDFFSRHERGPAKVADGIEVWLSAKGRPPIDRDELEATMLLAITTALGYAIGREVLWDSFGRKPTKKRDARFRGLVADMIASRLDA